MPDPTSRKPRFETAFENGLFRSRWLMAPFYLGLVVALAVLLVVFVKEMAQDLPPLLMGDHASPEDAILMVLSLIDLSLAGNLLLIVIFSGYENFVSKLDIGEHADRPDWMGTVDFSGLKLKLIASIVAISAIALLKAFMKLSEGELNSEKLFWLVMTHLTFVVSGILMALTDWITSKTEKH